VSFPLASNAASLQVDTPVVTEKTTIANTASAAIKDEEFRRHSSQGNRIPSTLK
jgi:hypothetical protein